MTTPSRASLHALVEQLPEELVATAEHLLADLARPRELTDEEEAGLERAIAAADRGEGRPAAEVFARFAARVNEKSAAR